MIVNIQIKDFKCFENESIKLRPLTLLTGTNSSGKSSLIQALLLCSNIEAGSDMSEYINSLGDFDELKNRYTNPREYEIKIAFNDDSEHITKSSKDLYPQPQSLNLSYPSKITYLNANRNSISETSSASNTFNQQRYFGIDGRFISDYFEKNKDKPIEEYLIEDNNISKTLESQVNYWLSKITQHDYQFQATKLTSTLVQSSFKMDGFEFKPNNIGAGIGYIATILISCLSATKENIIIIENPEIHLHPRSQAKMGEFLAFIASKGIQLIVETHNDHLINKIRYEIFKTKLKPEDFIIHYKTSKTNFEQIFVNEKGFFMDKYGENSFPSGFYDATLQEIFEINKENL